MWILQFQIEIVGVEYGNLGSRGENPGGICKSNPPYSLYRPENYAPEIVAVFPAFNPWCWDPICSTGGSIEGQLYLAPIRG